MKGETRSNMPDHDLLFVLRLKLGGKAATVTAWDRPPPVENRSGHSWIDIEVRYAGEVIFERGDTYCAVNAYTSTDGNAARELVLSTIAMKPGDTDPDFFAHYSSEQIEWAAKYGDEITMIAFDRYGDQ